MKFISFSAAFLASSITMAAAPIQGWYSSVFGGATWLFDTLNTEKYGYSFTNAQYHWGYHAGARFGYQSNPLRYELEYTYSKAILKSFDINGISLSNTSGNSNGNFFMANVYYDFPDMVPAVAPFLGLGIGYAYVKSSIYIDNPFARASFNASDSAFAYQGTAGFTYNFTENYAINVAYRYTATTQLPTLGKAYQVNFGSVGVIYRFDGDFYK